MSKISIKNITYLFPEKITIKDFGETESNFFNFEHFPSLQQLHRIGDFFGLSGFSFKEFKEETIRELSEEIERIKEEYTEGNNSFLEMTEEEWKEFRKFITRFAVRKLQDIDLEGGKASFTVFKQNRKTLKNLTRAFNFGLVELTEDDLKDEKKVQELDEKFADTPVTLYVSVEVYVEEEKIITMSFPIVLPLKDLDFIGDKVEEKAIEEVGLKPDEIDDIFWKLKGADIELTKDIERKVKKHKLCLFGKEFSVPYTVEIPSKEEKAFKYIKLGGLTYKFLSPFASIEIVKVVRNELEKRIEPLTPKDIYNNPNKLLAIVKDFLDEIEESLHEYYYKHPLNEKSRKVDRLIEILKEKGFFVSVSPNEIGTAFSESKNFKLIYEGESLSYFNENLKIYKHKSYPIYFVEGWSQGVNGYNYGYFVSGLSEKESELLKYSKLELTRIIPKRQFLGVSYDKELGLTKEELNPDEIVELLAIGMEGRKRTTAEIED